MARPETLTATGGSLMPKPFNKLPFHISSNNQLISVVGIFLVQIKDTASVLFLRLVLMC